MKKSLNFISYFPTQIVRDYPLRATLYSSNFKGKADFPVLTSRNIISIICFDLNTDFVDVTCKNSLADGRVISISNIKTAPWFGFEMSLNNNSIRSIFKAQNKVTSGITAHHFLSISESDKINIDMSEKLVYVVNNLKIGMKNMFNFSLNSCSWEPKLNLNYVKNETLYYASIKKLEILKGYVENRKYGKFLVKKEKQLIEVSAQSRLKNCDFGLSYQRNNEAKSNTFLLGAKANFKYGNVRANLSSNKEFSMKNKIFFKHGICISYCFKKDFSKEGSEYKNYFHISVDLDKQEPLSN